MVSEMMEKTPKLKYPKSVAFIISNEFCERFSYYGMRAVLVLYLTRKLSYTTDEATVLFHLFTSLAYFFPLVGAIMADSWLGRFKTIFYLSCLYAVGSVIVALGAIPPLGLPVNFTTLFGLTLISIGTGGIKPNVSAFGGDQFKLPEQAKQVAAFFSIYYFSVNLGSLISTTVTPILREDVHCFGEMSCYSLAFGVPGVLMVLSIVIFVLGKPFYKMEQPAGNMIVSVGKCMVNAIKTRTKEKLIKPRYHWLDYAEQKYGKKLVYDVKCLLKILVLFIPLPLFWALFDQQSSRWTFQAEQMDGFITSSYSIKPDQMSVMNPLIVVLFIPVINRWAYPVLERLYIRSPLQKMTLGMVLCAVSFVVSGILELTVQQTYPVLPTAGEGQLRIFNSQMCGYRLDTTLPNHPEIILAPSSMWTEKHIQLKDDQIQNIYHYNITALPGENNCHINIVNGNFKFRSKQAQSYLLSANGNFIEYDERPERSQSKLPLFRLLLTSESSRVDDPNQTEDLQRKEVIFQNADVVGEHKMLKFTSDVKQLNEIRPGTYFVWINGSQVGAVRFQQGGTYTIVVNELTPNQFMIKTHMIVEPNSVHILWQVPQYFIITIGEILFSVTGIEFSYTQAPASMKSVLQALWLATVTFGNIFVVIIAEIKLVNSQADEFFMFAVFMAIDTLVFIYLAAKYKYRDVSNDMDNNGNDNRNNVVTMTDGLGPTVAAIAAGTLPTHSNVTLSHGMKDDDKLDSSPKCLKARPNSLKNGVDNYGYVDI